MKRTLIKLTMLAGSKVILLFAFIIPTMIVNAEDQPILDFQQAITIAQLNDPWLVKNKHIEKNIQSMSIAADILPAPKMSIDIVNLPVDSFNFSQEPMTQFKVGFSQVFPRGDSLALTANQLQLKSSQYPYQRLERKAQIKVMVGKLWLDIYKAQESIDLIEKNRALFEQLADIAQASYSSAVANTRQQDIVRAQLELTRLDDRLIMLEQQKLMLKHQLSVWLSDYFLTRLTEVSAEKTAQTSLSSVNYTVNKKLPNLRLLNEHFYQKDKTISEQQLFEELKLHPKVIALEQKIKADHVDIELAKENNKAQWSVHASYAFRDSQNGSNHNLSNHNLSNRELLSNERSNFLSVGITFDMPWFSSERQDQQVQSSTFKAAATKTEKWLLLRALISSFKKLKAQLLVLNQRQKLYRERLTPQVDEQAEAALIAYTNDEARFFEVVRARILELDTQIDTLNINVEKQKIMIELNYFFQPNTDWLAAEGQHSGEIK